MDGIFTSSSATFIFFSVGCSVIIYLILVFDKTQKRKLKTMLAKTDDVQPLFMVRAANQKLNTIKQFCETDSLPARTVVARQLDELVAEYDKGKITLPDYCNRLNALLVQVA